MSEAFDNHALAALRAHPGQWHCLPCWAREAGLTAPEDMGPLRMLAGRLRFSREHESHPRRLLLIKDDVLAREGGQ
jgi:hypothetical protein